MHLESADLAKAVSPQSLLQNAKLFVAELEAVSHLLQELLRVPTCHAGLHGLPVHDCRLRQQSIALLHAQRS